MLSLLWVRFLPHYFRIFNWVFDHNKCLVQRIYLWFLKVWKFSVSYRSIDHAFLRLDCSSHLRRELIVWVSKCFVKFVSVWRLSLLKWVFFSDLFLLLLCIEGLRHHVDETINLKRFHNVNILIFDFVPIRTWISAQMALPFWDLDRRIFRLFSWSWLSRL